MFSMFPLHEFFTHPAGGHFHALGFFIHASGTEILIAALTCMKRSRGSPDCPSARPIPSACIIL